jgi:hypothetical protein
MSYTPEFKGTLCDTVGFRQHGGNCASDTILQLLLFTDGLKTRSQRILYTISHHDIVTRTHIVFPEEFWDSMIRYFTLIQERFRNHYDALYCERNMEEGCNDLRAFDESCPKNPILLRKLRRSPELATQSKLALRRARPNETTEGIDESTLEYMIPLILDWFKLSYHLTDTFYEIDTRAVFVLSNVHTPRNSIVTRHLSGLFRCNDVWYYYTNTLGLFKVSPTILTILDEIWFAFTPSGHFICVRHMDNKPVSVFIGDKEVSTVRALSLVSGPSVSIEKPYAFWYCSRMHPSNRIETPVKDAILEEVQENMGENASQNAPDVYNAFTRVAKKHRRDRKTYKLIMNMGKTIARRMNSTFRVPLRRRRGGYIPTRRNLHYLRQWKQGKSIGFTMRSSLKAKGLIPRANGTLRVSNKYKESTK